jgi:hypothetical protein
VNRALRQAWLLAGVLAVVIGLLGMHVLTAGHASHGTVPAGAAPHGAMPNKATAMPHAVTSHAAAVSPTAAPGEALAGCGAQCPGAQASGAPCIPTAPGSPVTIAPPQAMPTAVPPLPAAGNAGSAYAYRPPAPTPCDLSISRT